MEKFNCSFDQDGTAFLSCHSLQDFRHLQSKVLLLEVTWSDCSVVGNFHFLLGKALFGATVDDDKCQIEWQTMYGKSMRDAPSIR